MGETKIYMYEIEDWERNYLVNSPLSAYQPVLYSERLDESTADSAADAEIISVFIYSTVDAKILDKMPNLRMIATRSTGYDHIDLEECTRRGIVVSNVPYYGENTVAEHAFGLILSLSRKIYKAVFRTAKLDFSIDGLLGFDLKGRTLGVVGSGRIGLHVVRIAKGFGMNVLVYDVKRYDILAEVLDFTYTTFDELLELSDVITLHVPLNKATYHMINSDNIEKIKKGALLINTSRGAIVETEALISALDSGRLAGAGLDVFEGEESVKEESALLVQRMPTNKMREVLLSYALLHRDNIVITPHIAFYSEEALTRILQTTEDNIISFLSGDKINVVGPQA